MKNENLAELGPVHYGRKRVQPPRSDLKAFYREANEVLKFQPIWFDRAKRQALSEAFAEVVANRYTTWACAICSNHVHFCIRAHRDSGKIMWALLTQAGRSALRGFTDVDPKHPIWTTAPYDVFLFTLDEVRDRIAYINSNPRKERLPVQSWSFVEPYTGWPLQA